MTFQALQGQEWVWDLLGHTGSPCLGVHRDRDGFRPCGGFTPSFALPQVHKLLIVVELLLGEIPDRLQFRQPSLKRSLMPYFLLTQGTATHPCCFCPSCNLRES